MKIIIIGAGDLGRGVLDILQACNARGDAYEVIGFLDDDARKQGQALGGVPVVGGLDWLKQNMGPRFGCVIGVSDPKTRMTMVEKLQRLSPHYITVVHPSAVLGSDVHLGEGVIIGAGVVIAYATTVGNHVLINLSATVGHDCEIEDFVSIAPGTNVAGQVKLGQGCDIGLNCTIIRGLSLGSWSHLGPGTVALKDIPAGTRWFGNPARWIPDLPKTAAQG